MTSVHEAYKNDYLIGKLNPQYKNLNRLMLNFRNVPSAKFAVGISNHINAKAATSLEDGSG